MKDGDTEILIECVKYERSEDFKLHVDTGWSWRHVRVWPATLDRLEKEGFLATKTRNNSYHGYGVTTKGKQVVTGSLLSPLDVAGVSSMSKPYDDSNIVAFLNDDEINRIISQTLREHYKESTGKKRLPKDFPDYVLTFTEGGEANAIATAISIAQNEKTTKFLKAKYGRIFNETSG